MPKIETPKFEILSMNKKATKIIERAARTAYKSEGLIKDGSDLDIIRKLLKREHESVFEHSYATIWTMCNRGYSHELVRHRLCAFTQESTRYCNYSSDKFGKVLTVINPYWTNKFNQFVGQNLPDMYVALGKGIEKSNEIDYDKMNAKEFRWAKHMFNCENYYNQQIEDGLVAEAARGGLPNDLKTEIVISTNFREWRHIFKQRTAQVAHPDMRRITIPLLEKFKKAIPIIFDDIIPYNDDNLEYATEIKSEDDVDLYYLLVGHLGSTVRDFGLFPKEHMAEQKKNKLIGNIDTYKSYTFEIISMPLSTEV